MRRFSLIAAALAVVTVLAAPAAAQDYKATYPPGTTYSVDGIPTVPTITAKVPTSAGIDLAITAFRSAWQQDKNGQPYQTTQTIGFLGDYSLMVMARYLTANPPGSGGGSCDLAGARASGYAAAKAKAVAAANGL